MDLGHQVILVPKVPDVGRKQHAPRRNEVVGRGVWDEALVAGQVEKGFDADTSIGSENGERSRALTGIVQQFHQRPVWG